MAYKYTVNLYEIDLFRIKNRRKKRSALVLLIILNYY